MSLGNSFWFQNSHRIVEEDPKFEYPVLVKWSCPGVGFCRTSERSMPVTLEVGSTMLDTRLESDRALSVHRFQSLRIAGLVQVRTQI